MANGTGDQEASSAHTPPRSTGHGTGGGTGGAPPPSEGGARQVTAEGATLHPPGDPRHLDLHIPLAPEEWVIPGTHDITFLRYLTLEKITIELHVVGNITPTGEHEEESPVEVGPTSVSAEHEHEVAEAIHTATTNITFAQVTEADIHPPDEDGQTAEIAVGGRVQFESPQFQMGDASMTNRLAFQFNLATVDREHGHFAVHFVELTASDEREWAFDHDFSWGHVHASLSVTIEATVHPNWVAIGQKLGMTVTEEGAEDAVMSSAATAAAGGVIVIVVVVSLVIVVAVFVGLLEEVGEEQAFDRLLHQVRDDIFTYCFGYALGRQGLPFARGRAGEGQAAARRDIDNWKAQHAGTTDEQIFAAARRDGSQTYYMQAFNGVKTGYLHSMTAWLAQQEALTSRPDYQHNVAQCSIEVDRMEWVRRDADDPIAELGFMAMFDAPHGYPELDQYWPR